MNYIVLTAAEMASICGTYQEGTITRELIMGREMLNGNYALDARLLNTTSNPLSELLKEKSVQDIEESEFKAVNIR